MAGITINGKHLKINSNKTKKAGVTITKNKDTQNTLEYEGIKFGTVTNAGLKAIENNTLDSYTPATEEEKRAIRSYTSYKSYQETKAEEEKNAKEKELKSQAEREAFQIKVDTAQANYDKAKAQYDTAVANGVKGRKLDLLKGTMNGYKIALENAESERNAYYLENKGTVQTEPKFEYVAPYKYPQKIKTEEEKKASVFLEKKDIFENINVPIPTIPSASKEAKKEEAKKETTGDKYNNALPDFSQMQKTAFGDAKVDVSFSASEEPVGIWMYKSILKRHNIDENKFDLDDLDKWAEKHNFEPVENYATTHNPKDNATEQDKKDYQTLRKVAMNNAIWGKRPSKPKNTLLGNIGGVVMSVPYALEKAGAGAINSVESVTDFLVASGARIIGSDMLGDALFIPDEVSEKIRNAGGKVLASKNLGEKWNENIETRYTVHDWTRANVGTAFEGVGNLLPAIASEIYSASVSPMGDMWLAKYIFGKAPKLTTTANKVSKVVSPSEIIFGLGVAGQSASEGYRTSGDLSTSLDFGGASGLLEVAIERLSGGIAGTKYGKSILNYTTKSKPLSFILSKGGEAVEEMISTFVDTPLRRLTIDKDAEWADLKDYYESGKQGMYISLIMGVATYPFRNNQKKEAIKTLNTVTEELKLVAIDKNKIPSPLPENASIEDIQQRQKDLQEIAKAYANQVVAEIEAKETALTNETTKAQTPTVVNPSTLNKGKVDTTSVATSDSVPAETAPTETQTPTNAVETTPTTKGVTSAYTNNNQKIDMKYKVVSADDLVVSNNIDGSINPNYPQELQPRERTRQASIMQVQNIANNLVPEKLGESADVSDGAPIVYSDNVVESGNGRTMALKLMYKSNPEGAKKYIEYIKANADKFGIDANNLPDNPVLVRERLTDVDRVEFVKQANESNLSAMSATELAKSDAERLTSDILSLLVANDDGNINTQDNRAFVGRVISEVFSQNDLNSVVGANGMLSANGLERIRNAMFYKAYNDISLASKLSESLDNDIKNITNVLVNIAPKIVQIKNGIANGTLYNLDFSQDIVDGINYLQEAKRQDLKVKDFAKQITIGEDVSDVVKFIALFFEQKNRGAKQATLFFNHLCDTILSKDANQIGFLNEDTKTPTKEKVLYEAINKYNNDEQGTGIDFAEMLVSQRSEEPRQAVDTRGIGDNIESVTESRPVDSQSDGTSEQYGYVEAETALTGNIGTPRQSEGRKETSATDDRTDETEVGAGRSRELSYDSPEYETYETNKTVQPIDTQAVKKRRADATEQYGLTSDEATRLERYVGGQMCYILNKRMITGTLVDGDLSVINSIRNALLKMPEYSGRTYRNLQFKNEKEYNDFLSEYAEGNKVKLKAFTSTSKLPNGYTKFGNGVVHLVIDGISGRDIADTFGLPRQQEVIYLPETEIEIKKVIVANDGNPLIFAQEVKANENIRTKETGNTGNDRPKTSVHQNIDGQGAESVRDGGNNSGLSEKAQNRDRRDGVLSQWRKSADSGNVRVDNGQIEGKTKPKSNETKSGKETPADTESVATRPNLSDTETKENTDDEQRREVLDKTSSVSVGDTFTDTKNGDKIEIVGRDETSTTMEFTDKDGNVATLAVNNNVADAMNTNPRYTKTESVANQNVGAVTDTTPTQNGTNTHSKVLYSLSTPRWYPDLTKRQLALLMEKIKADAPMSVKRVKDDVNWIYTNIGDTKVFAIYSTADTTPTLLYESKGEQAEFERDILLDILEEIKSGKSINRNSTWINWVSDRGWMRYRGGVPNSIQRMGRGSDDRNAGVLQSKSKRKPSGAFGNVIENLFEVQDGRGYSIESEGYISEREGNLLSNGSGEWSYSASARKQTKGVDGRSRRYKEGRTASYERRKYCQTLKASGNTKREIVYGHKCEVIPTEHYTTRMTQIADGNKRDGFDETIFITGKAVIPFTSDSKGVSKTARGVFIKINGKKIVIVQYDNEFYTPEQINDHEKIHYKYHTSLVQKAKNVIMNSLSVADKRQVLEKLSRDYNGIVEGNEEAIEEEFVANVLSEMDYEFGNAFSDIRNAYWRGDEAFFDNFRVSEYAESIDAGGTNSNVLNNIDFGDDTNLFDNITRMEVFPQYDKYPYSDTGSRAMNWANSNGVKNLTKKVFYYLGSPYLVQKDISVPEGYKIVKKADINSTLALKRYKEYKGGKNETDSNRKEVVRFDNEIGNHIELGRRNNSNDYSADEYARKNIEVGELGKIDNQRREDTDQRERTSEYGDGNDNGLTSLNQLYISAEEFAVISKAIMAKNAGLSDNELKPFDFVYSANNFYTYKNHSLGNFTIIKKVDIVKNKELIREIIGEIKNGTNRGTESFNSRVERIRSGKRSDSGYNGSIERTDTHRSDDRLPFGTQRSDTVRHPLGDGIYHSGNYVKYSFAENNTKVSTIERQKESDAVFDDAWDIALEKYGAIQKGEKPARDIDVPKKRSSTEPISWFARTALEAGITPNEVVGDFEREIMFGKMAHEVITDKKAEQKAIDKIKTLGFEGAINNWNELVRDNKIDKNDFVYGMVLYNQAVTKKDFKLAMKLVCDLTLEATKSAQVLQSVKMLKKMTPDGTLYYLEKSVEQMNEEFKEMLGDKFKGIEIDSDFLRELYEAKTEEERDIAIAKIEQNIADQIPSTLLDQWNAWRYLAMLGNLRTHGRNVYGNLSFWAVRKVKNLVGAVIEKAIPVEQRTKSLTKSKESVAFAKEDAEVMRDILTGTGGKYEMANKIQQKRTIFKFKPLEFIRRKNFEFLEAEDWWFLKGAYQDSLAQLITARNIDTDYLISGTTEANELLNKVRAYAINEAKIATFRQTSELGNIINRTKRELSRSKNISKKGAGLLLEGMLPFTNVPINIAKQGVEYSPIGLLKGIYETLHDVGKGEKSASEAIDTLSKGLTGTAIVALGVFLRAMGWIVGASDEEEEDKNNYNAMRGQQSYALQVGDSSYTLDWLSPTALPLFVGAEMYDLFSKEGVSGSDILNGLSRIVDPMVEMSVLQGVSDAIRNAKYNNESEWVSIPLGMLTSYLGQALPTLGGQITRLIDNKQRMVYVEKGAGFFDNQLQRFIQTSAKKIPFASKLLEPQINAWGEEETYGSVGERIIESSISPGYYSKITTTDVDDFLLRLYEDTGEDVFPASNTVKSFKYKKEEYILNAEQSRAFAQKRGQIALEKIANLMYSSGSSEKLVKKVKEAYDKAHEKAKEFILEKYFLE